MNVSIPDKLKAWVESRVADGSYASTSDYVRDLLRADQRGHEKQEWLKAEIQRGLDSGISEQNPFETIEKLRQKVRSKSIGQDAA